VEPFQVRHKLHQVGQRTDDGEGEANGAFCRRPPEEQTLPAMQFVQVLTGIRVRICSPAIEVELIESVVLMETTREAT
jgi:hypothetical protein